MNPMRTLLYLVSGLSALVAVGVQGQQAMGRAEGSKRAESQVAAPRATATPRVAFYYGDFDPLTGPWELAAGMDVLVVEPGHGLNPQQLAQRGTKPIAYLSVGEVASTAPERKDIPQAWIAGENRDWGSAVLDVANSQYQDHLLRQMMKLVDQGYAGVFLDTLDSYQLVAKDDAHRELLRRQLSGLINRMAQVRPKAQIWLNRGFELLDNVAKNVHGVIAESLFDRFEAGSGKYVRVPEADRAWLVGQLRRARDDFHLPVVVIDYRPTKEREAARDTARRIAELGFIPYVSNGALNIVGVGEMEVIPRRVLLVAERGADGKQEVGGYHGLAPVLEHLGYAVDVLAVDGPLPSRPLNGTYQGIVTYLSREPADRAAFERFVERQVHCGVPLVIFGAPGIAPDSRAASMLGMERDETFRKDGGEVEVALRDGMVGFEADPQLRRFGISPFSFASVLTPHLVLADAQQRKQTVIATTAFGGVALSHFDAVRGLHGERGWVVDPFAFLARALRVPTVPRMDVATESGLRTAIALVRGDGAAAPSALPGRPQTARAIARELFDNAPLSHTVVLSRTDGSALSAGDARAAQWLGSQPSITQAETAQRGQTQPTDRRMLLQLVEPMAYPAADGSVRIPLPTAPDLQYIGDSPQSYPYAQVMQTLSFTESPRRLKPIALDYNAFSASTPGGLAMLKSLYKDATAAGVYPLLLSEYEARVRAFRSAPLLRGLNGAFEVVSEVPVTLLVPTVLGHVAPNRSAGLLTQTETPQGEYVTLAPGHSRITISKEPVSVPRITSSTGRLRDVRWQSSAKSVLNFAVSADVPLSMGFAGLPAMARCELSVDGRSQTGMTDSLGRVKLNLDRAVCGLGHLTCVEGE